MPSRSIFWFRQDLRTFDNTGLIECINASREVLPIFIFDQNIAPGFGGLGDQKFGFLREMLECLDLELEKLSGGQGLRVFHDTPEKIIPYLVKTYQIDAIFTNRSYGRYGTKRDQLIQALLPEITWHQFDDFLLVAPENIPQRKVFTPFYKIWKTRVGPFLLKTSKPFPSIETKEHSKPKDFVSLPAHPYFSKAFGDARLGFAISRDYESVRNQLDLDGTSRLSVYLRFGVYSVRELFMKAWETCEVFVSELAWREFWHHIVHYFPETREKEFQEKKRGIVWDGENALFSAWCEGKTGYPVVDACMRQLLTTNRMHGRGRMIVASFLTKDLHIDWRLGEAFFKKHLLDYDEALNFGNWQWSASVGADPKPLRIFNPILQSEKFDPQAKFIKKYLPELESESLKSIHNPLDFPLINYISPIVDHRIEQRVARERYKEGGENV